MSSITLKNIHKAYGKDVIIPDLNLPLKTVPLLYW